MPKLTTIKTNFTAGEISPRLLARVDITRYANGAKELYNAYALVHGGARTRQGTRFRKEAKNADKPGRLAPFVVTRTLAYVLEFGELYIRFFDSSGQIESSPGVPLELVSPWDDTELRAVKYAQSRNTMFLAHPSYPMQKLVRFSTTVWKLSQALFDVPPNEELGDRPQTTLTLSAVSGAAVTATAAAAAFLNTDVGRFIESGAGYATIVGFTSTTIVTVDIVASDAFASVGPLAANAWKITESPKTQLTPSATGPVGAVITLTAAAATWRNDAQLSHVGAFVEINGGLVEITVFTSTTVVSGVVRTALAGVTAAPSEGWALRRTVWNSIDGFPNAVGLFQQRLVAGGNTNYPNTVWGSATGDYLSFAKGSSDADAFSFELASDQVDAVEHIAATKVLFPLTAGAEWSLYGGVEKSLNQTNVQANPDTAYGCAAVRPIRVGNEVIYVEDGGKTVRALGFSVEKEQFNAPDISVLAEHITGDGLLDAAYQKKPDKVVWFVRADGRLVSMSIDRDQEAIGFASHETDGQFESVAVIPSGNLSQLWALVVRSINGVTKRYIETFEEGLQTDSAVTAEVPTHAIVSAVWAAGVVTVTQTGHGYATNDVIRHAGFTPAGYNGDHQITVTGADTYTFVLAADPGATTVVGTAQKGALVWAGFGHLTGETADIVADGYVAPQKPVIAGSITLDQAAFKIEGGLHFEGRIVTLPPEVGTGTGTAQGNALSIYKVTARLYKTKGGKINGQPINYREFGAVVLNQPLPEFTGDKPVEKLGWGKAGSGDSDGTITFLRDQPLPMQVLGVVMHLTANDG